MSYRRTLACFAFLVGALVTAGQTTAQDRHFPLHHRQPTGTAGRWHVLTHPQHFWYAQPVEFKLPTQGTITVYHGSPDNPFHHPAPATIGMMVGRVYRVRLSEMPEYPGAELYPTIEILDRIHPEGKFIDAFPIPVEITPDEIEIALQDRMVTKVIYLEQPDIASPFEQEQAIRTEDLPVTANLLKEADERGRPVAILRLGGRIPDPNSSVDEFYSSSPLLIPDLTSQAP